MPRCPPMGVSHSEGGKAMRNIKHSRPPRRWAAYEAGKADIAQRVARSGKEGVEAAKLYEREIKRHAARLRI